MSTSIATRPAALADDAKGTSPGRLAAQLAALNDEQRAAATLEVAPSLVLAGAGAGKTRVLVARIVHLVEACGADPRQILAITFTRKAAGEMRERLAAVLGPEARRMTIATMHSAALRMLRRRPAMAGLQRGFSVREESQTRSLVAELLGAGSQDDVPEELLNPVVAALSRLKDSGIAPDQAELERWAADRGDALTPAEEAAAGLYPAYQARLRDANEADFGDLVLWPARAMESDAAVRQDLAGRFRHLLVDEFQDTSTIQARWVTQLARDHRSLFCVADDDQTIYAWRGAEVDNVLGFTTAWPDGSVVHLSVNYRSTPTIVAASDALISVNARRLIKSRRAHATDAGEPIAVVSCLSAEHEASYAAAELARSLDADATTTAFVLYRANYQSRPFEEALIERGLAFAVVGDVAFYRRREVLDALAYARLMEDPCDADAFARIANVPARGLGDKARSLIVAEAAAAAADGTGGDLIAAAGRLGRGELAAPRLDRRAAAGAAQLVALAEQWHQPDPDSARLGDRLFALLFEAGYLEWLSADPDGRGGDRRDNITELSRVATLAGSVQALLERAARGAAAVDDEARLTLMTIHAAKGLEADEVRLVGWREGIIPSKHALEREARGNTAAIEEERRLAYVALTRARRRAVISFDKEGSAPRSRFITEIPVRLRAETRAPSGVAPPSRPDQAGPSGQAEPRPPRSGAGGRRRDDGDDGREVLPVEEGHMAVAAALLAAVDAAVAEGRDGSDWRMPWHDVTALPTNPLSGKSFSGSNVLTLWSAARRRAPAGNAPGKCSTDSRPEAPEAHYWASRRAWRELGGELRPSAEPEQILMPVYDEDRQRDHVRGVDRPIGADATDRKVPVLRGFRMWTVFNQVDVVGARLPPRGTPSRVERIAAADEAVRGYLGDSGPALVHGGVRAVYHPKPDRVTMPPREAFSDEREAAAIAYYAVLFHEACHSTGSRSRLRRSTLAQYDRDLRIRAAEELVAEIGAAMIGASLGIATSLRPDHVDYVASWRRHLADAPDVVMRSVAEADRAARFILDPAFRRQIRNR